jgi:Phage integrase, N-terminal SAM-like domain
MKGHIQRRGAKSWRLKFDAGRDVTGNRKIQYHTFRGTKREAQIKLAELIASVAANAYVEPSKVTVGEFVRNRVDQWESAGKITARTAARYRELAENQIAPYLGNTVLQKLRPLEIEGWHAVLRNSGRARGGGGLAPRTIGHAHRVLSKALSDVVENELVTKNVAATKAAPKPPDDEMVIVRDVPSLVETLKTSPRLYVPAMISLFTGMRLGEVLALRWGRVYLDRNTISVRDALEHTKAHGIRFKPPKSKAGRRDVTLPDLLTDLLREQGTVGIAIEAWCRSAGRGCCALWRYRWQPALPERPKCSVERFCGAHRLAGRDISRLAAHSRLTANRCRR